MVKKETLLLLAGLVWGAAGFNILRIGLLAYPGHVTLWNLALSALVFGLFQGMVFGKLVQRHTARILGYGTERKWFWQFFDGKSFLIMVFMIAFGIGLRASGLAPEGFIAVFYTGLGASLLTTVSADEGAQAIGPAGLRRRAGGGSASQETRCRVAVA